MTLNKYSEWVIMFIFVTFSIILFSVFLNSLADRIKPSRAGRIRPADRQLDHTGLVYKCTQRGENLIVIDEVNHFWVIQLELLAGDCRKPMVVRTG